MAFSIDTGSATLGVPESDAEMPKAIWFNVAKFPQATFKSTAIKGLGNGKFEVAGKLDIKGNARDVVVPVQITQSGANSTATGSFAHQAARLQDRRGRMGRHHGGGQRRDGEVQAGPHRPGRAVSRAAVWAACLAAGWPGSAQRMAQAPNYAIDPTHTFVNYENGHYGTTTNRGRFSTKDGTLFFDRAGRQGKVEIIIDISSVNTGVDFLNRQIQGKDFFNVADYPTGSFVSDKFVFEGDKVSEVHGQLTLKDKTHPVVLKAHEVQLLRQPAVQARGLRRRLRDRTSCAASGASCGACSSASRTRSG